MVIVLCFALLSHPNPLSITMSLPESVTAGICARDECRDDPYGETSDEDSLLSSDEEEGRSPAFYLAQAEERPNNGTPGVLYAARTQELLNKAKEDWDRYGAGKSSVTLPLK